MQFCKISLLLAATVVSQECTYQLAQDMNYDMLMSDSNLTPASERCELWRHQNLTAAEEHCSTEQDCVGVTYDFGYTCENDSGQQVLMRYEIRKGQLSHRTGFNSWTKSCISAITIEPTALTCPTNHYNDWCMYLFYSFPGGYAMPEDDSCENYYTTSNGQPVQCISESDDTNSNLCMEASNSCTISDTTTTIISSVSPTTSIPTREPTPEPSMPINTDEPLTLCENKDDSDNITDTFDEVVCLCDEYESGGWTWERNVLTDDLGRKVRKLEQAGGELTDNSPTFLKRWKKRMGFHVYLHESADDNTMNNVFYHRRVWRRICLSTKRRREMMRKFALMIDSLDM